MNEKDDSIFKGIWESFKRQFPTERYILDKMVSETCQNVTFTEEDYHLKNTFLTGVKE